MTQKVTKVHLSLTEAALNVLNRHASPRKRGEFISAMLMQYAAADAGVDQIDVENMKLNLLGLAANDKMLEARMLKLERQVATLIAGH